MGDNQDLRIARKKTTFCFLNETNYFFNVFGISRCQKPTFRKSANLLK